MIIMGSLKKYNIGDKTIISGPKPEDGLLPCMIIREATLEEYLNQNPAPMYTPFEDVLKRANYYEVSVD